MSQGKIRAIHMASAMFCGGDAAYRMLHMFIEGARPIDWAILIVDFLVLAVIVWLDAPERFHKKQVRKRLLLVQRIMLDGHALRNSVYGANTNTETASEWTHSVQTWIDTSHQSLANVSMQAALSFMHRNVAPDVSWGGVTHRQDVSKQFQELLVRLDNLRNIMEKADVYF
jgi:hypothetical protein